MTFSVEWSPKAQQELSKLEKPLIKRILQKVEGIKENPFSFLKKLTNDPRFSLRVGDYRILISVLEQEKKILVLTLGHRKNIYKR